MLTTHILQVIGDAIVAAPGDPTTPPANGDSSSINAPGLVKFFATIIAPIICGGLGCMFLMKANKGEVSKVLTSTGISIVGFAFIGGAFLLPTLGPYVIDLFLNK